MDKPRCALLTSLVDYSPAYSLNHVILAHAKLLTQKGYPTDLLCLKSFNSADKPIAEKLGLSVKYILPQTTLIDYACNQPPRPTTDKEMGFEDQVNIHLNGDPSHGTTGYLEALKDYDVIISHDILFLSWHLPQNAALRKVCEAYPEKNWLSVIHSGPSNRPGDCTYPSTLRYEAEPNTTYIFLNSTERHACALMLGTTRDRIAVVYNPMDQRDIVPFAPETCSMIDAYDLYNHDLLEIYPFSTPRYEDKGVKHLIVLFSMFKKIGVRARLVLVNAHGNSKIDQPKIKAIEDYVTSHGLQLDRDVILTSRFSDAMSKAADATGKKDEAKKWREWRYSVPKKIVSDLQAMSNIFVFPSFSECCSLIQAEASISGKFVVLNSDFSAMAEFAHKDILQFAFSRNDPDDIQVRESGYYECVAREIWAEYQNESAIVNATLARTKTYNRDHIFRTQFEPLLWRKFKGKKPVKAIPAPQTVPPAPKIHSPIPPTSPMAEDVGSVTIEALPTQDLKIIKPTFDTIPPPRLPRIPDYKDPQPDDPCPVYGTCSTNQRSECYRQAGHCPVLDEELVIAKQPGEDE